MLQKKSMRCEFVLKMSPSVSMNFSENPFAGDAGVMRALGSSRSLIRAVKKRPYAGAGET